MVSVKHLGVSSDTRIISAVAALKLLLLYGSVIKKCLESFVHPLVNLTKPHREMVSTSPNSIGKWYQPHQTL